MSNLTIIPSETLLRIHELPHILWNLNPVSHDFSVTYSDPNLFHTEYGESIVVFPAYVTLAGFVFIVFFFLVLVLREYLPYCRCCYKDINDDGRIPILSNEGHQFVWRALAFSAVVVLAGNQYLAVKNVNILTAYSESLDAFYTVLDIFADADLQFDVVNATVYDIMYDLNAAHYGSCNMTYFTTLMTNDVIIEMKESLAAVNAYYVLLLNIKNIINGWSFRVILGSFLWSWYILSTLFLIGYLIGTKNLHRKFTLALLWLNGISYCWFFLGIMAYNVLMVLIGDFCIDPKANSLALVNPNNTGYRLVYKNNEIK